MANRRPQTSGRRMDFGRNDRGKNFARSGVSPWQGGGPGSGLPNLLPLASGSTEATLALASNIINLLQPRQNPVPSLLDMPIRRDFGPSMGRYDRGYVPNRMGNQGNYRRTGNYNRAGERINTNRKPYKPNDGQRQQNKISPKKEGDSKTKPVKESDQDEKQEMDTNESNQAEGKDEDKKEAPKTRYDDINSQLLKCHICNKSMWDGRSFENHLSGRAHAIMMQKTAESYALTADTMRQEFKIREMKRSRKSGQQPARDFYCAMCDMYAADGAVHRTTVGHRKLKKYLHPTCASCHKEMPTRIELDEHRLTAEHLRNIQDKQEITTKPKPEVMVISTYSMEQMYLREDRQRRRRPENQDQQAEAREGDNTNKEGDNDKQEEGDDNKEKPSEEEKPESGEEKKPDPGIDSENTILDYKEGDDLSHITPEMYPSYSTERGVGASFLGEFRCVQCKLCRKLLDNEETAQLHLRTWRHQQLFIRLLQEHYGRNKRAQEAEESNKRPSEDDDNDSGNWKRRKTTAVKDEDGQDNSDEPNGLCDEDVLMKEDPAEGKPEGDNELDGTEVPEEDLEDWEQTVDEILEDEKDVKQEESKKAVGAEIPKKEAEKVEEKQPVKEEVVEKQPVKEKSPPPVQAPTVIPELDEKPRGSPRGRGRGRARGRGRY